MSITFLHSGELDNKFDILCSLLSDGHHVVCAPQAEVHEETVAVVGHFAGKVPDSIQAQQVIDTAEISDIAEQLKKDQKKPWKPWFPVIDYDRCTNCMQCMNFCLFGVYGLSQESKLQVQKPHNCKTECPACSRVCPEAAIMFPKYKAGPINGDEVSQQDLEQEKMKIDISSLLGGDIYSALRQRSERASSRFAKERDEDRALKERKRCLKKLQKDLDIPDEVLNSLPIPKHLLEDDNEQNS